MALIETETEKSKLVEAIRLAEGQLDALTTLAAKRLEDVKVGDEGAVKTAEELRRLVKIAIELETRHERERKRDAGFAGGFGLDLEQARSQIRCKLGRIRRCCRSGDLPE